MAQAAGFRPGRTGGGGGKGKQLDLRIARVQIAFPRLPLVAPHLPDHGKAQYLGIKGPGPRIVGTDDRDMMDGAHVGRPITAAASPEP
ncbi:hypothetical protein YP76_24265 [Sphingobium chungbukense]|uniref:Uncharacterized protein n=1 Tax=Sphingobium chungbukense TaxID=56193 RepID=A0A0M3AHL4_9SPHN|nr:hypothetical protein YP76_24265 [Sphingobium chungbukense]